MAWTPQTVKVQGIPPAVLHQYLYFLFGHSHDDTRCGSAHNPFRPARASFSNPSSAVYPSAYIRYHAPVFIDQPVFDVRSIR